MSIQIVEILILQSLGLLQFIVVEISSYTSLINLEQH